VSGLGKRGLVLEEGSRVAVVGGGPAGSLFAYFVRLFARRVDRDIRVDIYEPRDFWARGPTGCNMCGGMVSESLVQNLALDGINLPDTVVQRGIDSYVLHTEGGSCRLDTPALEKRIAAVHRGGGPRNWASAAIRSVRCSAAPCTSSCSTSPGSSSPP
jgi:flavin-dependent dehydrogenase